MDEDDVWPERLQPGRRLPQDEAPEVGNELQIERADELAGQAGACRSAAYLLQPELEGDIAALDHVEQALGVAQKP